VRKEISVEVMGIDGRGKKRTSLKNEDIKTRQLSTLRTRFPQKLGSYPHFYVNALGGKSFRGISNKGFP
jgi:hypothetical protein